MPEIIKYGLIGKEDLNIGTGMFTVTLPDGLVVVLSKINSTTIVPNYSNTTRPSASSFPAGYQIYNTDDNAPNWSDGTNWRDATGTVT